MTLETITVERGDDGVAVVTLNRPDVHNAFNETMQAELRDTWHLLRTDADVRCVVITAAGEKSFCTGIDRSEVPTEDGEYYFDPYTYDDPGRTIGPRSQGLWKPVIAAVNGMACGGAFYLLGEVDFIISADHATYFDPHVTYGMPAVFEPVLMQPRMPFGEVMRMTLMGTHERISAQRAYEIGLVSQVVPAADLQATAREVAATIASQPAPAVQASLRTLWAARELASNQLIDLGNMFLNLSMSPEALKAGQQVFTQKRSGPPTVR